MESTDMFTDGVLARESARGEYRYVHRRCGN